MCKSQRKKMGERSDSGYYVGFFNRLVTFEGWSRLRIAGATFRLWKQYLSNHWNKTVNRSSSHVLSPGQRTWALKVRFRAFEVFPSCQLTPVVPEFPRHSCFRHQSPPGACTSAIEKGGNYANLMQAGNAAANTWQDSQARLSFSYFPWGASAGSSNSAHQIGTVFKPVSHLQPLCCVGILGAGSFSICCAKAV